MNIIGITLANNSIRYIQCDSENIAQILDTHYNSGNKARKLVDKGDIKILKNTIDKTIFYGMKDYQHIPQHATNISFLVKMFPDANFYIWNKEWLVFSKYDIEICI